MVRRCGGFTLLEVMMVMVIVSILVTLSAPRLFGSRQIWYLATLQSDLKNFVLAQEQYFITFDEYGSSNDVIAADMFDATNGVTLVTGVATATGFNATATHAMLGAEGTCGVYVGDAAKPDPSLGGEGDVGCY